MPQTFIAHSLMGICNSLIHFISPWRLLGLCNNFGYVVMLSAAHDILGEKNSNPEHQVCFLLLSLNMLKHVEFYLFVLY